MGPEQLSEVLTVKASKLGLLLLILAFGAAVETAWQLRGKIDIGPTGCRVLRGAAWSTGDGSDQTTLGGSISLPADARDPTAGFRLLLAPPEPAGP